MSARSGTTVNPGYSPESRVAWFAVQVRSQHEKGVVERLVGTGGFKLFLPLYKCRKRWSDRIKEFEVPLFPGYVFCRFDPTDRLPILKTPGVSRSSVRTMCRSRWTTQRFAVQTLVSSGIPNNPGRSWKWETGFAWNRDRCLAWKGF